jgi:1-acyl-sn-glycerol-3-phosphate acyltransferase
MKKVLNVVRIVLIFLHTALMATLGTVFILITFNRSTALKWAGKLYSGFILLVSGVRLKVEGRENIPPGVCIFVANHESLFDIPAMFMAVDRGLFYVAKKELAKVPFMGWYMWVVGMIFIDRGNKEKARASIAKAAKAIRNGKNVILYPEGTRTKTGVINQFKRGPFNLALESGVPIIPCRIIGARAILASGEWMIKPGTITVRIGTPVSPKGWEARPDEFAQFVRERVGEMG